MHLKYSKLAQSTYFTALKPKYTRVIFKARTRMYDIKTNFTEKYEGNTLCPFCRVLRKNLAEINIKFTARTTSLLELRDA